MELWAVTPGRHWEFNGLGQRLTAAEPALKWLPFLRENGTRGTSDSKLSEGRRFASSEFGGNADDKANFARLLTKERMRLPQVEARGDKLLNVAVSN